MKVAITYSPKQILIFIRLNFRLLNFIQALYEQFSTIVLHLKLKKFIFLYNNKTNLSQAKLKK